MDPRIVLAFFLAVLPISGCKTQGALSAEAIGCGVTEVDVIDSRYSREGTTTAWCAKCRGKTYHCVSNPDRSRVECKEVDAWSLCE
jgi:hypothetical protein